MLQRESNAGRSEMKRQTAKRAEMPDKIQRMDKILLICE